MLAEMFEKDRELRELKGFIMVSVIVASLLFVIFCMFNLNRGYGIDKYAPDNVEEVR